MRVLSQVRKVPHEKIIIIFSEIDQHLKNYGINRKGCRLRVTQHLFHGHSSHEDLQIFCQEEIMIQRKLISQLDAQPREVRSHANTRVHLPR